MGQHATIHGKDTTPVNGASGSWQPIQTTSAGQIILALLNGELTQFNRLAGGSISPYVNLTSTGTLSATPCIVHGYVVTAAMSAATTTVYDNTAASGTVLFVIPASTAVGTYLFPVGIQTTIGAFASFAGTGTVNFVVTAGV